MAGFPAVSAGRAAAAAIAVAPGAIESFARRWFPAG